MERACILFTHNKILLASHLPYTPREEKLESVLSITLSLPGSLSLNMPTCICIFPLLKKKKTLQLLKKLYLQGDIDGVVLILEEQPQAHFYQVSDLPSQKCKEYLKSYLSNVSELHGSSTRYLPSF